MQIVVLEDFERQGKRAAEWDRFMEEVGCEIFLSYDWSRTWWEFYGAGRRLKICWFTANGETAAILPIFLERLSPCGVGTEVAKLVSTDHSLVAVSIPIKPQYFGGVLSSLREMLSDWGVGILHLGAVAGKYADLDGLVDACRSQMLPDFTTQIVERDVQTYFPIAGDWEQQLARLSKQERKHMRQVYRQVDSQGAKLHSEFATEETFDTLFQEFVAMHQAKWQAVGKPGHFGAWPAALEFHRSVALRQLSLGRLRLLRVSLNGHPVGYKYAYRFGSAYYAFLDARSGDLTSGGISQSRLIFCEQVKKAIAEGGVRLFDSMRGRYEHKIHLGGEVKPLHLLNIVSRDPGKAFQIAALRSFARLLDILYYRLWRRRLVPWLGMRQGPLSRAWIRSHMLS